MTGTKPRWLSAFAALTFVTAITVAPAAGAKEAPAPNRFSLSQIFDLQWAADPQISPDGARVVFVRSSFDVMKDSTRTSLWMVNADGSDLQPLTRPDVQAGSPRWSPSGDRLAYVVSDNDHRAEIRVRWMATGRSARVATLPHGPRELTWSPDGKQLAFAMFVSEPQHDDIARMPSPPKGADWGPKIKVIDRMVYRFNGRGYLPHGHTQLFVVPGDGGAPFQVTHGDDNNGGNLAWSADGKSLIFSANRHPNPEYQPLNSEIYEVSAGGGKPKALTHRNGPDRGVAVSPDGEHIAYVGFNDRRQGHQVTHLYVMNRDGSGSRDLTAKLDRSAGNPQWSHDGDTIYFQYDDEGVTRIGAVTLGGKRTRIATDVGGLDLGRPYSGGSFSLARNADAVAFTLTAPDHPADVAVARAGHQQRLTDLNAGLFAHEQLATVETLHFRSSYDRREIEGWIMKPPGFDAAKKYPLILEIHGGPFANYGPRFSAEDQLYAAAGYVVLYINPRGSTSYGEKFGNLINHDYPDHDYDDLMSGVDTLLKKGYVDPRRLFVTGGSGGGVLTAWIVGHTDRFRAAVVAKPVINWYSWVLTADLPELGATYWFKGPPWEHVESYVKRSPISYVGNVKTPTMVMTGEVDYRTPSSEAEQFYEALKLRKVPTTMIRIPDASHEIAAKPSNMMAKVAYILGWFRRYGGTG